MSEVVYTQYLDDNKISICLFNVSFFEGERIMFFFSVILSIIDKGDKFFSLEMKLGE
jgi:hypothetical protein